MEQRFNIVRRIGQMKNASGDESWAFAPAYQASTAKHSRKWENTKAQNDMSRNGNAGNPAAQGHGV